MHPRLAVAIAAAVLAACRDAVQAVRPVADVGAEQAGPAAHLEYQWIPLGDLPGVAADINDHGQVVGSAHARENSGAIHAFLWDKAVAHDLGTLGGMNSEAIALNERGQVVGWADTPDEASHAYLWERGTMRDIGPVGHNSGAWGINERGQVIGYVAGGGSFGSRVWGGTSVARRAC